MLCPLELPTINKWKEKLTWVLSLGTLPQGYLLFRIEPIDSANPALRTIEALFPMVPLGFEPRPEVPKTSVLPLHQGTSNWGCCTQQHLSTIHVAHPISGPGGSRTHVHVHLLHVFFLARISQVSSLLQGLAVLATLPWGHQALHHRVYSSESTDP